MSENVSSSKLRILIDCTTVRSGGGPIIAATEIRAIRDAVGPASEIYVHGGVGFEQLESDGLITWHQTPGRLSGPALARWMLRGASELARNVDADIFVSFTNWLPFRVSRPSAMYVHSPYVFRFRPKTARDFAIESPRYLLSNASLQRTNEIVVQTPDIEEQAKQALIRRITPRRGKHPQITVVPPIPDWPMRTPPDERLSNALKAVRHKADFWLFYPSHPWKHKNFAGLASALRLADSSLGRIGLILPGGDGGHFVGLPDNVHVEAFNGLSLQEMAAAYRFCDAVIFPSLLETAGLGLAEALMFDKPLAASDRPFAHHMCGGAALFFDPTDPRDIARAIRNLRTDAPTFISSKTASSWRAEAHSRNLSRWTSVFSRLMALDK